MKQYAAQYPWMELVQLPQRRDRSFAAKVQAFNAGYERVKGLHRMKSSVTWMPISLSSQIISSFFWGSLRQTQPLASREPYSKKKAIARKRTALKGTSMCQGNANCFAETAGSRSADTFRTAPEESTGWPSRRQG